MAELLSEVASHGIMSDYIGKLLTVYIADEQKREDKPNLRSAPSAQPLIEPLSEREIAVLQLIARELGLL